MTQSSTSAEIEALEETVAWRLRLLDVDPADRISSIAVSQLEALIADLRGQGHETAMLELNALLNWLSESGAIVDYSELTREYRSRIGGSDFPANGDAYLTALLKIARSLT